MLFSYCFNFFVAMIAMFIISCQRRVQSEADRRIISEVVSEIHNPWFANHVCRLSGAQLRKAQLLSPQHEKNVGDLSLVPFDRTKMINYSRFFFLLFFLHTPFYHARSLSAGLFFMLASLQMYKINMALSAGVGGEQAGGRVAVGVKGQDVAEERLGSIDVVGCGSWQMGGGCMRRSAWLL